MVSHLIQAVSFAWAMRVCGFLVLFLLIIANLTVRNRCPPKPQKATIAQLIKPLTEVKFVLVTLGFFLFNFGLYVPSNYVTVNAVSVGLDLNLAQYLIPILNAASLFGRLGAGVLGDRIGQYNVFMVVCYLSGIWVLALWLPDSSQAALIAFSVLFGFFSGAYISLTMPLIVQISPMSELGFRTGIAYFISGIAGLTTNPINGAILDGAGGWTGLKVFAGVFCLVGTTFVLAARVKETGWKVLARY